VRSLAPSGNTESSGALESFERSRGDLWLMALAVVRALDVWLFS